MKKILQISLVLISITGYSQSDCETYDIKKDTLNFKYLRGYISVEQKALAKSGTCIAKGVLIEKRTSDFYLNVKVIESCDEKGLYTGLDSDQPNRQITKVGDTVWTFYNDWEPRSN